MVIVDLEQRTVRCGDIQLEADGDTWEKEALAEAVVTLLEVHARAAGVRVDLGRSVAQARRLTEVPPVREEKLAGLFALQAGRLFRRSREALTINGAWIDREAGEAMACAAPEAWLEAVTTAVESTGRRIESFGVAGCPGSPELIPPSIAGRRAQVQRKKVAMAGMGVAFVWLLAAFAYAADLVRDDRLLAIELEAMETPLLELRRARESVAAVDSIARILAPLREERWSALQSWVRIAEVIPPGAHLDGLVLDRSGKHVITARAGDLSQIVEQVREHSWLRLEDPGSEGAAVDSVTGMFSVTLFEGLHD
jgi:hypothetical protein